MSCADPLVKHDRGEPQPEQAEFHRAPASPSLWGLGKGGVPDPIQRVTEAQQDQHQTLVTYCSSPPDLKDQRAACGEAASHVTRLHVSCLNFTHDFACSLYQTWNAKNINTENVQITPSNCSVMNAGPAIIWISSPRHKTNLTNTGACLRNGAHALFFRGAGCLSSRIALLHIQHSPSSKNLCGTKPANKTR